MAEPHYLSTEDAARRLGLSRGQFRRLVGLDAKPKPHAMAAFVRHWMRPNTKLTGDHMWLTKDVDALAQVLAHWQDDPGEAPAEDGDDD